MNTGSLKRLIVWILILLAWEGAYRIFQWRPWVFPAPSGVLDSILQMLNVHTFFGEALHRGWPWTPIEGTTGEGGTSAWIWSSPLISAPLISGVRLAIGFTISIVLGAMLGAAMWRWRGLDEFLGPLFLGMQTLPSVCWVPLGILLFGLNEVGILFVLVMGSCFAIAISLRDGLRTIPPIYQRAGQMLGARGWRLYAHVLFPASLPALTSSLRQGFSFAWRSLMGAELIFITSRHGLGFLLAVGRDLSDVARVVAVMAIMVFLGMLADRLVFAPLERRVHGRFGLATR